MQWPERTIVNVTEMDFLLYEMGSIELSEFENEVRMKNQDDSVFCVF